MRLSDLWELVTSYQSLNSPAFAVTRSTNTETSNVRSIETHATFTNGSSTTSGDSPPYVPFGGIRPITILPKRNNYHRERKIFPNPKKTTTAYKKLIGVGVLSKNLVSQQMAVLFAHPKTQL